MFGDHLRLRAGVTSMVTASTRSPARTIFSMVIFILVVIYSKFNIFQWLYLFPYSSLLWASEI